MSDDLSPAVRLLRLDAEMMPQAVVPSADVVLLRAKWRRRQVEAMRVTRALRIMDNTVVAVAIALLAIMVAAAWYSNTPAPILALMAPLTAIAAVIVRGWFRSCSPL